jgi:hypothetical protein
MFLLGGRETYLVRHARPTTEENESRANSGPLSQWLAFGNYPRGADRRSIFIEASCGRDRWLQSVELRGVHGNSKGTEGDCLAVKGTEDELCKPN